MHTHMHHAHTCRHMRTHMYTHTHAHTHTCTHMHTHTYTHAHTQAVCSTPFYLTGMGTIYWHGDHALAWDHTLEQLSTEGLWTDVNIAEMSCIRQRRIEASCHPYHPRFQISFPKWLMCANIGYPFYGGLLWGAFHEDLLWGAFYEGLLLGPYLLRTSVPVLGVCLLTFKCTH